MTWYLPRIRKESAIRGVAHPAGPRRNTGWKRLVEGGRRGCPAEPLRQQGNPLVVSLVAGGIDDTSRQHCSSGAADTSHKQVLTGQQLPDACGKQHITDSVRMAVAQLKVPTVAALPFLITGHGKHCAKPNKAFSTCG